MPEPDQVMIASPSSGRNSMFVGPQGVRPGWRVLMFVPVLLVSFAPLPLTLWHGVFSAKHVIMGEVLCFGVVLLGTSIFARVERRSLADYGLPFQLMLGKQFWAGAVWGFVMLSVIVAAMLATHTYSFGGLALSPLGTVKYALLWALAFLLVGLYEEFSFRGYIQYTLTRGMGFWPAAAATSILFAAGHLGNPGENWVGVVEIVLIAIFLCTALRRTGNLWFAIGWHMAFDWGETFFYSTPNSGIVATGHMLKARTTDPKWLSGGSVGPEASVFDLIVTVAGILLLLKLYPEAKYPQPSAAVAVMPDAGDPGLGLLK